MNLENEMTIKEKLDKIKNIYHDYSNSCSNNDLSCALDNLIILIDNTETSEEEINLKKMYIFEDLIGVISFIDNLEIINKPYSRKIMIEVICLLNIIKTHENHNTLLISKKYERYSMFGKIIYGSIIDESEVNEILNDIKSLSLEIIREIFIENNLELKI